MRLIALRRTHRPGDRRLCGSSALLGILLLLPLTLSGQTARLTGAVVDLATGGPLAGVMVVLRGTPLSTYTDGSGRFEISSLDAGRYTVFAAAIGYSGDSVPGIVLTDGERRDLTLALRAVPLMLPEMVVTAGRSVERSEDAVASVSILPARDIVQRQVTTIDKALAFVPGVTFNGEERLDIRGAAGMARGIGSRVLMLLDGHPILTGDGGEIDFRSIPLLDLDRTEVVKGAYSAVYGSGALGGVVNLITTPVAEEPHTVARAHVEAFDYRREHRWAGGTQAAVGLGLQHSRRLGTIGARAFVGYEDTDGYTENGESNRWIGRVKLASPLGSLHPWDAYAVVARERAGENFIWRSMDQPFRAPETEVGNYTVTHTLLSGGTFTPRVRASTLVRLSPYFNISAIKNYFSDNHDWHTAYKPGLLAEFAWYGDEGQTFSIGIDAAQTLVRSNFFGQPKIVDLAAFAQDEVQFARRLKGTLGIRVDYHKANLGEGEWAVSPKVGIAMQLSPGATLRASVGSGYRAPSAIEQFVSSQQFGFRAIPNPALKGEHAWSGEIGTSVRLLDRIRIDAAVFGSTYTDLISPGPAPGQPFVFQFQNVDRARVAGLDVGVHAQVVPGAVEMQVTYLLLDTEDRDTGSPLPYRARHNVTGTLNVLQGLAGIDVRYRSRIEDVLVFPLDPRAEMTVVDLRLGYRALNVLWQLKVANVFNQFFVDAQERQPGAPRTIAIAAVRGL